MNLLKRLQLINIGRFLVYTFVLLFSILLSLWMDGLIVCSIWAVFLPLWLWKMLVLLAAVIGLIVWFKSEENKFERVALVNFRAMLISTMVHILIALFEVLVCIKLDNKDLLLPWTVTFVPLMFLSLMSILLCLWAIRNDRSFEIELFCVVNILQFVFICIKLDNYVGWSWLLVFIPLWVVLTLAFVFTLYTVVTAIIFMLSSARVENRNISVHEAFSYIIIVVPLTVYAVLLVEKLDAEAEYLYSVIGIPLYVSIVTQALLSFTAKTGNIWWFGLRKDFCQFLVTDACPCLQEYGNISYKLQSNQPSQSVQTADRTTANQSNITSSPHKYIMITKEPLTNPANLLDLPD